MRRRRLRARVATLPREVRRPASLVTSTRHARTPDEILDTVTGPYERRVVEQPAPRGVGRRLP
jgi:hypothetical protein